MKTALTAYCTPKNSFAHFKAICEQNRKNREAYARRKAAKQATK